MTDIQKNQNYLEILYQIPESVSKKFQKDISSRTGVIYIFWFQLGSKPNNRLTNKQEIQVHLKLVNQHPRNVSKDFHTDISSRAGSTTHLSNFNNKIYQLTEWQTDKNSKLFGNSGPTSKEYLQSISKTYPIQNWRYSSICVIAVRR